MFQRNVGDFVAAHQQRHEAQIGGDDIDAQDRIGGVLQPDVMQAHIAVGEQRNLGAAVDHEGQAGRLAQLALHRTAQGVAIGEP